MNKFIPVHYLLAAFLFALLHTGLSAQSKDDPSAGKKSKTEIIIIEETTDAGGKRIKKTIRTEGDLSDEELERILEKELGEEMEIEMILDADNVLAEGEEGPNHGYLGVTIEENELGDGVVIEEVREGSPAEAAGLASSDIITSVQGIPIRTANQLVETIRGFEPGSTIEITYLRGDSQLTTSAELAKRASSFARIRMPEHHFEWNQKEPQPDKEIHLEYQKPRLGVYIEDHENGVEVTEVISASLAEQAGLREGDVITHINDQAIQSPDALIEAVKSAPAGKKTKIRYLRNGKSDAVKITF